MESDNDKKRGPVSKNVTDILKERDRLDQILQQEYRKEVTIVLTDICGYTSYIDTRGDISGRGMLLKHNEILLPEIKKHHGKVVEMVGDAVMASFSSQSDAVKAAVAIQKALREHNVKEENSEKIQVKIGINYGKVLVDDTALYQGFTGDVANVAARIQSQAGRDEILVSKTVYDSACKDQEILMRFFKMIQVKGKAEPVEIYRVVWQEQEALINMDQADAMNGSISIHRGKDQKGLLELEIARDGDQLKLSAYEQISGEESTIRYYEEIPISMDMVKTKCREMIDTLNKTNRSGCLDRKVLMHLKQTGQMLYDELFSLGVKEKLKSTKAEYLSLKIDDQLVHVPWELLFDGQQFLCLRFNMGRLVKTRQSMPGAKMRNLASPLKMLILADPSGDLKGAYEEGIQIRDHMDQQKNLINTFLDSGNITADSIKAKLRSFDIVHFAGHADYNLKNAGDSGWLLSDANLKARDITKMIGVGAMPALIFSNACQSARTEEWLQNVYFTDEVFGLTNAFLLAGVRHYVGTFWEVSDEHSNHFALYFYKKLIAGKTIGEAIRLSRLALIKKHGENAIGWASYALYGDPTFNYQDQLEAPQEQPEPEHRTASNPAQDVRTREEVIDFSQNESPKKTRVRVAMALAFILFVAVILWGYPGILRTPVQDDEKTILTLYNEGNFQQALEACEALEKKYPQGFLAYLIQGNILLANGKIETAEEAFEKASQREKATEVQKAQALVGLGRIASIKGDTEKALNYYQQASGKAPDNRSAYLSQALLLEGKGDFSGAMGMFGKAQSLGPEDGALAAISRQTQQRMQLADDREKQDRIDTIVKELLETMNSISKTPIDDGWTSFPLTLWVMDFDTKGYSLQEGRERLLIAGITDQIINQGRIRLVERSVLDKLVEELKLGTSKLADQNTSLSLGKILAARLMVSGHMIFSGPQVQISMRLIETETGQISAAIAKAFGSAVPASLLAKDLSEELIHKIIELYPLRGKILDTAANEIRLNIGKMAGVRAGQQFKIDGKDVTLKVIAVNKDTSLAKVEKGALPLEKSLRVEVLRE
jgi:class 3 adenylate cyclase/tetratricopeptide (TPR) repeat protein